jgi:hypothetical protein
VSAGIFILAAIACPAIGFIVGGIMFLRNLKELERRKQEER